MDSSLFLSLSSNFMFLIYVSFLYRVICSIHDGLSNRAKAKRQHNKPVGWWPWHILNWLRRDVPLVLYYIRVCGIVLSINNVLVWLVLAIAHRLLHTIVYKWTRAHTHYFTWGKPYK